MLQICVSLTKCIKYLFLYNDQNLTSAGIYTHDMKILLHSLKWVKKRPREKAACKKKKKSSGTREDFSFGH